MASLSIYWFLVVRDKITAKAGNIIFWIGNDPPAPPFWKLNQHEKKNVQNLPVSWFYKKYDGIASVISDISAPSRNCTLEWWIVVQCWPLLWQWSILIGHGWSSFSMFISTGVLSSRDFSQCLVQGWLQLQQLMTWHCACSMSMWPNVVLIWTRLPVKLVDSPHLEKNAF